MRGPTAATRAAPPRVAGPAREVSGIPGRVAGPVQGLEQSTGERRGAGDPGPSAWRGWLRRRRPHVGRARACAIEGAGEAYGNAGRALGGSRDGHVTRGEAG